IGGILESLSRSVFFGNTPSAMSNLCRVCCGGRAAHCRGHLAPQRMLTMSLQLFDSLKRSLIHQCSSTSGARFASFDPGFCGYLLACADDSVRGDLCLTGFTSL